MRLEVEMQAWASQNRCIKSLISLYFSKFFIEISWLVLSIVIAGSTALSDVKGFSALGE